MLYLRKITFYFIFFFNHSKIYTLRSSRRLHNLSIGLFFLFKHYKPYPIQMCSINNIFIVYVIVSFQSVLMLCLSYIIHLLFRWIADNDCFFFFHSFIYNYRKNGVFYSNNKLIHIPVFSF